MAVFQAFHPNNETLGAAIMAMIEALDYHGIDTLLTERGIDKIEFETWYPQQIELDIMKHTAEKGGMMDMIAVGMKIPDIVEYPMEIKTVIDALTMLDAGYQHNHRGEITGSFSYELIDTNHVQMTTHLPYPPELVYGILYRLVQKYRPNMNAPFSVQYVDHDHDIRFGGEYGLYDVKW